MRKVLGIGYDRVLREATPKLRPSAAISSLFTTLLLIVNLAALVFTMWTGKPAALLLSFTAILFALMFIVTALFARD